MPQILKLIIKYLINKIKYNHKSELKNRAKELPSDFVINE